MARAQKPAGPTQDKNGDVLAGSPAKNKLIFLSTAVLKPHPKNPRRHTVAQIRAIAKSIETFGFTSPVLVDKDKQIIAGHGRYEAAKLLGQKEIPVVFLDHLST